MVGVSWGQRALDSNHVAVNDRDMSLCTLQLRGKRQMDFAATWKRYISRVWPEPVMSLSGFLKTAACRWNQDVAVAVFRRCSCGLGSSCTTYQIRQRRNMRVFGTHSLTQISPFYGSFAASFTFLVIEVHDVRPDYSPWRANTKSSYFIVIWIVHLRHHGTPRSDG